MVCHLICISISLHRTPYRLPTESMAGSISPCGAPQMGQRGESTLGEKRESISQSYQFRQLGPPRSHPIWARPHPSRGPEYKKRLKVNHRRIAGHAVLQLLLTPRQLEIIRTNWFSGLWSLAICREKKKKRKRREKKKREKGKKEKRPWTGAFNIIEEMPTSQ